MKTVFGVLALIVIASFFVADEAYAHHLTAKIPVESSPMKMAIADDFLYVAHNSDRTISVIDIRTNLLFDTIETSGGMMAVESAPDKNKLYSASIDNPGIDVYDLDTGIFQKTITLPDSELLKTSTGAQLYGQRSYIQFLTGGWSLDYNPNNELLYVANYGSDVIQIIDTRVEQVMNTIPVADDPYTVKIDPITNKVIVASLGGNAITIIEPSSSDGYSNNIEHSISSEIKTSTVPWCLDIDPIFHYAYISHRGSNIITVVNILEEEEVAEIKLPGSAQCVTVDEKEHRVYVSLFTSDHIVKINGETFEIIDKIETTGPVWDLIVDPNTHNIYASHKGADEIFVFSPASIRESVPIVTKDPPIVLVGTITAHGQDVKLIAPYLDVEETSIISGIQSQDGGSLTVDIPCYVLEAQENGQDSKFQVTIDGKKVIYDEAMNTNVCRSISFFVPENSENLQIKGTDVLVESTEKMQTPEPTKSMELTNGSKIICEDKVWIESANGRIACVFPSTAQKLVERGWGTMIDEVE